MCIGLAWALAQPRRMTTQFSMLQIMNAALISQAFEEVLSENDGSDEFRLLSRNWPLIVEAELEEGLYHHTRRQMELLNRQDGKFGFADAYAVPDDALHVRRVWTEDDSGVRDMIEWSQDGGNVYADADAGVFIEYMATSDPSFWGANFSAGVQKKLEAVLLRFREEHAAAERMEGLAEGYFQKARTMSSKSRTAQEPYKRSRYADIAKGLRRV